MQSYQVTPTSATMSAVQSPLVSVLIPAYNAAPFIATAIDSILNQSYPHFELWILDDGSTDNTKEVLSQYSDPRLQVFTHTQRQGIPKSRNQLIALAKGDFIAWLDADDFAQPQRLEKQVASLLSHHSAAFCASNASFLYPDKKVTQRLPDNLILLRMLLFFKQPFVFSSCMIRKSIASAFSFDRDLLRAQDWMYLSQLATHYPFCFLTETLVTHRVLPAETKPDTSQTQTFVNTVFTYNLSVLNPSFRVKNEEITALMFWLRNPRESSADQVNTALHMLDVLKNTINHAANKQACTVFYQYQVHKAVCFKGVQHLIRLRFVNLKGLFFLIKSRI